MPTCICSINQNLSKSKHHYWTLLVTSIHNLDWLPMPCENYGLKVCVSHLSGNIRFDLQPMCNMTKLFISFYLKSVRKGYDDKDMILIDDMGIKHGKPYWKSNPIDMGVKHGKHYWKSIFTHMLKFGFKFGFQLGFVTSLYTYIVKKN
jgi:hypothetical protein